MMVEGALRRAANLDNFGQSHTIIPAPPKQIGGGGDEAPAPNPAGPAAASSTAASASGRAQALAATLPPLTPAPAPVAGGNVRCANQTRGAVSVDNVEVPAGVACRLEGTVLRDGVEIFRGVAFNDVVVARGSGSGMVELRVSVDGHFMYNQRSDGLIVATPTGSTAYALSAGGPILQPQIGGIAMVPIAPHALSNRPIVLCDSGVIEIEIANGRDCSINFDMQSLSALQVHDRVMIRRSAHTVTFLHPQGWSYYDTLREKLHWNEYPSVSGQLK
jgi:hypothetical protein